MAESEAEVRARVDKELDAASKALAQFYVGRQCPLLDNECKGPRCMFFLQLGEADPNNPKRQIISQGQCSIPLAVTSLGPLTGGIAALAEGAAKMQSGSIIPGRG